jgi:hypothetical protein
LDCAQVQQFRFKVPEYHQYRFGALQSLLDAQRAQPDPILVRTAAKHESPEVRASPSSVLVSALLMN